MKKVIIAFDGSNFSEGAINFAISLNKLSPIFLTGVFLPQAEFANLWSYAEGVPGPMFIPMIEAESSEEIHANIHKFESICAENAISCHVHKDFMDFAVPELLHESRFADLLIIGSESFYEKVKGEESNFSLKQVLVDVECPVVIVPEVYNFPTSNILAYDGTASSTYSIKQFSYLLPEFTKNKSILVYANDKDEDNKIPDQKNIEELTACHFKNIEEMKLKINPHKYFSTWVVEQMGSILVCGCFARTSILRIFHKNFVNEVIQEHKLPVFVAHMR
jgi:nucleotide-binding universal stress UspA family protein